MTNTTTSSFPGLLRQLLRRAARAHASRVNGYTLCDGCTAIGYYPTVEAAQTALDSLPELIRSRAVIADADGVALTA